MKQPTLGLTVCGALLLGAISASGVARADDPLGGKAPWSFTPQNRAAIAVAIKNAEDGGSGGGSGTGGGTTVLCGGTSGARDGSTGTASSATANSTCVIVTNSAGATVAIDQDSIGNQDADSSAESTTTTHNNNSSSQTNGSIDEVAAILGGRRQ